MNETEEYLQEAKKDKYSLQSESDTLPNDKSHNIILSQKGNTNNKITDEDVSLQEEKYYDNEYYEEQIDADHGAYQRRQYFQIPNQNLKSVEDESVCSHWESEFPSNVLTNAKRFHNQQSFEAKNSQNSSRNYNFKMVSLNNINPNGDIKINLNNITVSQDKGNHKNTTQDNTKMVNTSESVINQQHQSQIADNVVKSNKQNLNEQDGRLSNLLGLELNKSNPLQNVSLDNKNLLIDMMGSSQRESGLIGVWKHSSLLIITLVKKFQTMLMSHSNQNKFRALDKKHFDVIGDKSVNCQYYTKYKQEQDQLYLKKLKTNNLQKKSTSVNKKGTNSLYSRQISTSNVQQNEQLGGSWIFLLLLSLLSNVRVIQPNSRFKIAWNIIIFNLLIINFFIIPLKVSFSSFMRNDITFKVLSYITGFIFLVDTIMNFNSAYFSKGLIITDRRKIIKNYMKKNFFIDLFTLLAFAFSQFSYYYAEAGVLIKIFKLAPIMENFEEILNLRQRGQAILSLAKLVIFILMVTHILGCTFFLLARIEETYSPNSINWIEAKDSWGKDWYDQYVLSLYWSVVTMITVGYGDVTPSNTIERLFCIIVMLISCGVFAFSINQIGGILDELSKRDAIFRDNMSLITSYLKQRGISYDLQLRIRKYFQYLHKENLEDNEKSEGLLDLLPSSLKNQLGREMYVKILNDQKVFRLNFSQKFIIDLSLKMKEKKLGPEEMIFQEKDYLDRLYFLIKGQVELFVNVKDSNNNSTTSVSFLNKGRLLGQTAFFTQLPCSTGARCVNVTSLIFITRDDFVDIIRKHSKDYEKFCMLRDNLQINHISRGLGTKCHLCGSFNHSFIQCHLVRYTPMQEKIILRYNRMVQSRDPSYTRNDRRNPTSSARIAHEYLKDTTINFLLDYNPADTDEESVLEIVENLKRYYAHEELKWKSKIKSDRVIEDQDEIEEYYGGQSPTSPPYQDPNSIILQSENILRQQSEKENGYSSAPLTRKKKRTLSHLQVEDLNSESNVSFQPLNIMNSPMKRKRPKDTNSSENLNNFTLQNTTLSNNANQNTPNEIKDANQTGAIVNGAPVTATSATGVANNNTQQNQSSLNINLNNTGNNNSNNNVNINPNVQITTIQNYLKSKNYQSFRTTSSRPDKAAQDDSQIGNSEVQSNYNQMQTNLNKRANKRRNNIIGNGGIDEEILKKNCFSDLMDFDRYLIFEIYFVEGNINKVLEHYNNEYIHLKIKEEGDTTKKKSLFKRLVTKKKLTKSERSMNILKNKIIQKRSQNGRNGTYYTQNQESDFASQIYQSVRTGKNATILKNGGKDDYGQDSTGKNALFNANQSISFNDYMIKNEISKSANPILQKDTNVLQDSSDKYSDKLSNIPNLRKIIQQNKK